MLIGHGYLVVRLVSFLFSQCTQTPILNLNHSISPIPYIFEPPYVRKFGFEPVKKNKKVMSAGETTIDAIILRLISLVITQYLYISKGPHIFIQLLAQL